MISADTLPFQKAVKPSFFHIVDIVDVMVPYNRAFDCNCIRILITSTGATKSLAITPEKAPETNEIYAGISAPCRTELSVIYRGTSEMQETQREGLEK